MNQKIEKYKNELITAWKNILDYWIDNGVDLQLDGFVGRRDHFNKLVEGSVKGAVLNTRILWSFAAAYRYFKDPRYKNMADRAYDYLVAHFVDREYGGVYWAVDAKGNPENTRKQIYAQGFGIYGFSEYYRATGRQDCLDQAKKLFSLIEQHSFDAQHGGYLEALDNKWLPLTDMRLSDKDENYPKSMNTHLHILEPYTNLYRVWPDDQLASKMKLLIRTFLDHIIDSQTGHFHLFFDSDWTIKSNVVSFGHDIEGAWLLTEAAEVLGDELLLQEVSDIAIKMSAATMREGMDASGGLNYDYDPATGKTDTDKHWWPQAEAMVGFLNAYELGGDPVYLSKSMDIWQFIKEKIIDRRLGEWYWRVDDRGNPYENEDKAGFWKCPYHNSRACMEGIQRLEKMLQNP